MSALLPPSETAHTPHGERLRTGLRGLRFDATLEAEYRAASLEKLAHPSLVAALAGTVIWLAFAGVDLVRLDLVQRFPHWPVVLWQLAAVRLLVLLAFATCIAVLWSGRGRNDQRAMVAGMFFVLMLGSAIGIAIYLELGEPHESYVLALVAMAIFLPLGLGFFEMVALALACIAAVAALGLVMLDGTAAATFMRLPFVLLVTSAVSAIGAYLREYAQRGQFLLVRELQWLAARDPLTGLFNRRVFSHHLDTAVRQAQRDNRTAMLLLLDVDHFKLYNDTYGHQAGDEALRRLARALQGLAARPLDMAFRAGGEELGLILVDATVDDAHALGVQLLDDVSQLEIAHAASATANWLSVSAGCALLCPGEAAAALERRADQLLYKAKSLGRNCVALDPALGGRVLRAAVPQRDAVAVG